MIYLTNTDDNVVVTDSYLNYIPVSFNVYLDDVLIGEIINDSTVKEYFIFTVLASALQGFEFKEYQLSLYADSLLLKSELLIILSNKIMEIKSIDKSNKIIQYE